ncbi:MAG: hypothetical protein PSX81_14275 [bacterium]|nr:hypothetical protein [bacterium]
MTSETNITMLDLDSSWQNIKSKKSLLRINYQTGETTLKVNFNSFASKDTTLSKIIGLSKSEFYLNFNINRDILNLLTKDNKVYTFETPGMLYFNEHFHSVIVKHSFYNKNGNIADLANNKVFASISCTFSPLDFQLDWLNLNMKESIKLWMNKQSINFFNIE